MSRLVLIALLLGTASGVVEPSADPPANSSVVLGVRLHDPQVGGEERPLMLLRATSRDKPSEVPPVELEVYADDVTEVRLPNGRWTVEADTDRYWGSPVQVVAGPGLEPVYLDLWPSGFITGRLTPPRSEDTPAEMTLVVHPTPDTPLDGVIRPTSLKCPLDPEGRFRCRLPAGELDLRFVVADFVHHFAWNVRVSRDKDIDIGRTKLRRGSAVQGWVVTEDGSALSGGVVYLRPRAYNMPPSRTSREMLSRSLQVDISERGFFQLVGARAGAYFLEAEVEGYSIARTSVRVAEDRLSEVSPPLVVTHPLDVNVYVTPAYDPWGKPWNFLVKQREDPTSMVLTTYASVAVPETGVLLLSGLAAGRYVFFLRSEDGQRYWRQEVDIDGNHGPVVADLDYVNVEGEVRLGDDPLVSTVYFGGSHGAVRVDLPTDEEGRYQGFLPRTGEWDVTIEAKDPPVSRDDRVMVESRKNQNHAEVNFILPMTRVKGRVVDGRKRAVYDAVVDINAVEGHRYQVASDKHGWFELVALEPGTYQVKASTASLQSDTRPLLITENDDSEIELVMRPVSWIRGMLFTDSGPGMGGEVRFETIDPPALLETGMVRTDAQGLFRLRVPAESRRIVLRFTVHGFAYRMLTLSVTEEQQVNVRLDQAAGTLVVQDDESPDEGRGSVFAFNDNGHVSLMELLFWARSVTGEPIEYPKAKRYVVPMMEPGDYGVCRLSMEEVRSFRGNGLWKASDRCSTGYLSANGELRLDVPETRTKAN